MSRETLLMGPKVRELEKKNKPGPPDDLADHLAEGVVHRVSLSST